MRDTVNISLPGAWRTWVEKQVARGAYGSTSEFFRHLLREERRRQDRQRIDVRLVQAIDSGESRAMTEADWSAIRKEGQKRLGNRSRK